MRLADVEHGLEELFPLHLAESWDPVGRQLGRDDQIIRRMMLTIDATEAVVEEAIAAQVDLLLAYHPVCSIRQSGGMGTIPTCGR